jgi:hypothetical protein
LGDTVDPQVRRLVEAGSAAANCEADLYWSTVHRMARAKILDELSSTKRRSVLKWVFKNPPNVANEARDLLIAAYSKILGAANVSAEVVRRYQEQVSGRERACLRTMWAAGAFESHAVIYVLSTPCWGMP